MIGELEPTEGTVGRHSHLCIARYHQHSTEVLDPNKTVLEYFMVRSCFKFLCYPVVDASSYVAGHLWASSPSPSHPRCVEHVKKAKATEVPVCDPSRFQFITNTTKHQVPQALQLHSHAIFIPSAYDDS